MDEYVSTFLTLVLVTAALFFAPLIILSNRIDDSMQTVVEESVSEFVDRTRAQGYITFDDYYSLLDRLDATGNTYNITLYTLESDYYYSTGFKGSDGTVNTNGYASGYKTTSQSELLKTLMDADINTDSDGDHIANNDGLTDNSTNGRLELDAGDYIYCEVVQTNSTIGQKLLGAFLNSETPKIQVRYGGMTGNGK